MTRVAGFGFRKGAGIDSLLDALMMAGAADLAVLATVDGKAEAQCMLDLSERLGLPIAAVSRADLVGVEVRTVSQKSLDMYGTGSVSEAAALVAAGDGACLIVPRMLSANSMATCAIAEIVSMTEGPSA